MYFVILHFSVVILPWDGGFAVGFWFFAVVNVGFFSKFHGKVDVFYNISLWRSTFPWDGEFAVGF